MPNLETKLKKLSAEKHSYQPQIFDLGKVSDKKIIDKLISNRKIVETVDQYESQLIELSELNKGKIPKSSPKISDGIWVHYPWRRSLVHILDKADYENLRTSRNHNLVTPPEQKKWKSAKIGFAGLNVGNPAAVCVALSGGSNYMKMADLDELSLSNLNRFRAGLMDLGVNKAVLSARQVYEVNPFAKLELFSDGIKQGQEEEFLLRPKIDILIEEMDDLYLKISMREAAKKNKIPVIMVTGNGSNLILDVERYDKENNLPIMNNKISGRDIKKIKNLGHDMLPAEKIKLARDFIGAKNLTRRLRGSFEQVGKSLAGIPQLAETSFLRGATLTFVAREIILGRKMRSGRYEVNLEEIGK